MQTKRLSRIELYAWDEPDGIDEASGRLQYKRYGILRMTCGIYQGIGHCLLSSGTKREDVIRWGSFLRSFRACTLSEAWEIFEQRGHRWSTEQRKLVHTVLMNLMENRIQARLYRAIIHKFISYRQLSQRSVHVGQKALDMNAHIKPRAAALTNRASSFVPNTESFIMRPETLYSDSRSDSPFLHKLKGAAATEKELIHYATAYYSVL
ncbi:MAG: hypothetical protein IKE34_00480 [Paenibacillus sp.]|nr:hypothetical protein [Paenibacillus sp.]